MHHRTNHLSRVSALLPTDAKPKAAIKATWKWAPECASKDSHSKIVECHVARDCFSLPHTLSHSYKEAKIYQKYLKGFSDGLSYSTSQKSKETREMLLPTLSPIPSRI